MDANDIKPVKKSIGNGLAGPGRPKGVPNKQTKSIKEMVEGALEQVGGMEYMAQQARDNPAAFMALVGKLIPKDVTVSGGVDVKVAASEAVQKVMDALFKAPNQGEGN